MDSNSCEENEDGKRIKSPSMISYYQDSQWPHEWMVWPISLAVDQSGKLFRVGIILENTTQLKLTHHMCTYECL